MSKEVIIRFQHDYFKLKNMVFPTVRGKSWLKKVKPGDRIKVTEYVQKQEYFAVVLSIDKKRINDLSADFIELDGSYNDNIVFTHLAFMELLNSFRRFENSKIKSLDDEIAVLWLRKIVVGIPLPEWFKEDAKNAR